MQDLNLEIAKIFKNYVVLINASSLDFEFLLCRSRSNIFDKVLFHQYQSVYNSENFNNIMIYKLKENEVSMFMPIYYRIDGKELRVETLSGIVEFPYVEETYDHIFVREVYNNFLKFLELLLGLQCTKLRLKMPSFLPSASLSRFISTKFIPDALHYKVLHETKCLPKSVTTRKSYKNLINRAIKAYSFKTIDTCCWEEFHKYVAFHKFIAGRITRSISTWKLNHSWLSKGHGFIVEVTDHEEKLIGFALFRKTGLGYHYTTAAYNRNKQYDGISHATISVAINYASEKGANYLYLGDHIFGANKKEANITKFKYGFANNIKPELIMKLDTF